MVISKHTELYERNVMTLATFLTALRLLLAPFFAMCFLFGYKNGYSLAWLWAGVVILVISELSDAFDGFAARSMNQVTDFGKVFDPVSDSLSRLTAFIAFMQAGLIPLWMFLMFMYRDSLMALLRIICAKTGLVLAARRSGKIKAIIQAAAIFIITGIALLEAYGVIPGVLRMQERMAGFWIVLIPALVTVLSFFDYIIPNWSKIKAMTVRTS